MKILHYGLFQRQPIVDVVLNQDRDDLETGQSSRPPAALPRYEFVETFLPLNRSNDQGLENPELLDRSGERLKALIGEGLSRLKGIRSNRRNQDTSKRTL